MSALSCAPRILIVRLSAIGDAIHGMPVLNALRDALPDARLGWVVEDRAAALLRGHASLDELIEVPRGWLKSPSAVWQLRRRLRAFRPDVTIDVQGLTKSAVAARLSGARRRIGFSCSNGRELSRWLNNELVSSTAAHVIDANLELLEPLGITPQRVRFAIPASEAETREADQTIRSLGLARGFAIINTGAGWPSKLWPPDRYAAVAERLRRQYGMPTLVVWAGPKERTAAEWIVAGSDRAARLAPATSLPQLAALARRARLFIGSDTGPLHLAVAVGTPCVGLYGPMPAERNGPYGPRNIALQRASFEGSSRERRSAPSSLMEAIGVEDVCEACATILRRSEVPDAASPTAGPDGCPAPRDVVV